MADKSMARQLDVDSLACAYHGARDELFVIYLPGCGPCEKLKEMLVEARILEPRVAVPHVFVVDDADDPRLHEILGKQIRIFPSLCYRSPRGTSHWLHGIGDKSGQFNAQRIADWVTRMREFGAGVTADG